MLITSALPRTFQMKQSGKALSLPDPNPTFRPESVLNFYSNTYPELTTAKISGPRLTDTAVEYQFDTIIGTKG